MSEEILKKILDTVIETRGEVGEVKARLDRIERTVDGHTARFDRVDDRLDRIEVRLDRVDGRLDNIESELGTVKDAVMDVSKKVRSHDLAIKEIKERFH